MQIPLGILWLVIISRPDAVFVVRILSQLSEIQDRLIGRA